MAYSYIRNQQHIIKDKNMKEKDKRTPIYVVYPNGLHPLEGSILLSPECLLQSYKREKYKYPK